MTHLIDLYFKWEQPWCQVVDESLFRQSKQTNGRYFSPLLLNCILAIASRYCDRPEVRSDPDDPNTAGRIFLDTAEVLLHFDLKWPSITTIQSLEIMAIHYVVRARYPILSLHHSNLTGYWVRCRRLATSRNGYSAGLGHGTEPGLFSFGWVKPHTSAGCKPPTANLLDSLLYG